MHTSAGDMLVLMAPIVGLLIASMLRLDEHLFASVSSKRPDRPRPRFSNFDQRAEMVLADPDGRVARSERK